MNQKELLTTALEGQTPARTPISIFRSMLTNHPSDDWQQLIDQGLAITEHFIPVTHIEHGVDFATETRQENSDTYTIHTKKTPVGIIRAVSINGWQTEWYIKNSEDYKTAKWIVEHTELVPNYADHARAEKAVGNNGVAVGWCGRTPVQQINLEHVGTEKFCLDIALEDPDLFTLYGVMKAQFMECIKLLAAGPGRYFDFPENVTINMLGPQRYKQLLMPVYQEFVPLLETVGKRVMVHYDGALSPIADQIAAAPFHMIESLTEPPEGDMTYDQCRAAWPDKVFWANINLDCYNLPPDKLRQQVIEKRTRAGKRGFAFEISEDLPPRWRTAIPVILKTLQELE